MSEQITLVTALFAAVLALSLLIERAIEVMKSAYDLLDSRNDFHKFWTRRTYRLQQYMEKRLRVFEYVDTKGATAVFNRFNEMLLGEADGYKGTVPTLCGDLVRAVYVRLGCKIAGSVIGIALAYALGLDIIAAGSSSGSWTATTTGMLITGVAMGLGAGPMHKLIRVVEKKRSANIPQVVTHG